MVAARGKTAHSTFKILFDIMDDTICSIPKNSALTKVLQNMSLLIWDECSMQNWFTFEAINCTLHNLHDCNEMFGGITMILGGDFLQTLPIFKGNLHSPIIHACLLSSPLWLCVTLQFGCAAWQQVLWMCRKTVWLCLSTSYVLLTLLKISYCTFILKLWRSHPCATFMTIVSLLPGIWKLGISTHCLGFVSWARVWTVGSGPCPQP